MDNALFALSSGEAESDAVGCGMWSLVILLFVPGLQGYNEVQDGGMNQHLDMLCSRRT